MRRAINTIPRDEYDKLLREAMQRMSKKFRTLIDEEESKMMNAENQGNYDRAERYDFNARALRLMAGMYYHIYRKPNEIEERLKVCEENIPLVEKEIGKED